MVAVYKRIVNILILCLLFGFTPDLYAKQKKKTLSPVQQNSRHYLTIEGGIGYSALMHQTPNAPWKGLVGAELQIGYEWKYKSFLLHTGLELSSLNNINAVNDFSQQWQGTYSDPLGTTAAITENYAFSDYRETQLLGQLNIPVMAGARFNNFYFLAGAKLGVPLWHTATARTALVTTARFDDLIGEMAEVKNHNLYTATEKQSFPFAAKFNPQLSAEIGYYVYESLPKATKGKTKGKQQKKGALPVACRVSVFADYGLISCVNTQSQYAAVSDPAALNWSRQFALQPVFSTTASKVNSLLVGAKASVMLQVSKEPEIKRTTTTQPSMLILTISDENGKPTASNVTITNITSKRVLAKNKPVNKGLHKQRVGKGDYVVEVSKPEYYTAQSSFSILAAGDTANLNVTLRPRPWLRLHVTNAETGEPLAVTALVSQVGSAEPALTMPTDSTGGNARILLEEGQYEVKIQQLGYEAVTLSPQSIGDSLNVALNPLKKGRVIVLHNLFFASYQTRILPASEPALNDLYLFLSENPEVRIRIVGHTDSVGSKRDNQKLSEGRSEAVKQEMVDRGIDPSRIETDGKGEDEPVATNETEEGRALNRRVEFTIL